MTQSSFYGDEPNYATDYPTQGDSNTNPTTGNTPAPSSMYPGGVDYVPVTTVDATLEEVEAAVADTLANAGAASASASAAAASAAAAGTSSTNAASSASAASGSAANAANAAALASLSEANAASSASAAAASATAASGSASTASGSATAASSSATAANTSAGNAATSETNAANSASAAAASATNAATAVQAAAGTATPLMDGTAAVGTGVKWAREDHRHPTDTSRAPLASPAFTGNPTAPTPTAGDNDTSIATTAFVTAAVAAGGGGSIKKNYIVNGAMMVSQENGTAVGTTNLYYPVDQFFAALSGSSGTFSVAQVASVTPAGSPNRCRFTVTAADAAVASGDVVEIETRIEGLRTADLMFGTASAKTITLQFGVKAPAGTYCVAILNSAGNRSYVAEYVISSGEANTDVIKRVTIPGDVSGTWLKDTGVGIDIRWGLMVGSTYQQAAGAWGTGNVYGSANQFNLLGTVGNVFELFDVGLYEGSSAPVFVVPDYASELVLCKRYFQRIGGDAQFDILFATYSSAGGVPNCASISFTELRATPTVTFVGSWLFINATSVNTFKSRTSLMVQLAAPTGGVSNYTNNAIGAYLALNARL